MGAPAPGAIGRGLYPTKSIGGGGGGVLTSIKKTAPDSGKLPTFPE
jgi:hypothetical protein